MFRRFSEFKAGLLSPTKFVFIYFFPVSTRWNRIIFTWFLSRKGHWSSKEEQQVTHNTICIPVVLKRNTFLKCSELTSHDRDKIFLACSVTRCVALSLHYRAREPRAVFTHFSPTVKTQLPQNLETTHVRRPFRCCTANRRIDKFRPRVCKHRICNLQIVIDNLKYINISG